jgi:hypothetical protein
LIVAVTAATILAINYWGLANDLRLELAAEKAMAATGACGDQFVVTGLGKEKDEAAVAGRIVESSVTSQFFQKEEDGRIAIYHRTAAGDQRLFIRPNK